MRYTTVRPGSVPGSSPCAVTAAASESFDWVSVMCVLGLCVCARARACVCLCVTGLARARASEREELARNRQRAKKERKREGATDEVSGKEEGYEPPGPGPGPVLEAGQSPSQCQRRSL